MICDSLKIQKFDFLNYQEIIPVIKLLKYSRYIHIGQGTYSNVYRIANRVLKIGLAKLNENIVSNSNIVPIYYKHNIKIKTENIILTIGIEVQEYANKSFPNKKELYSLYKKLRDDGIIWMDIKPSNTGLFNEKLVVIDTNFLFIENAPKNFYINNNIDCEFDIKYNKYRKKKYDI